MMRGAKGALALVLRILAYMRLFAVSQRWVISFGCFIQHVLGHYFHTPLLLGQLLINWWVMF
jgi:hypothetical protein